MVTAAGEESGAAPEAAASRRQWRLPRLGGPRSTLFKVVWGAAVLLALAAMAIGNHRSYVRSIARPFSHIGLGWFEEQGEIRLRQPFGPEAIAAGIGRGDRIVAIDGVRVPTTLGAAPEIDRRLKGPEGSVVSLAVQRADDSVAVHRLTRTWRNVEAGFTGSGISPDAYRLMQTLTNILPDFFMVVAAFLLFRGRREEPVCALLSLSLLLLAASGGGAWSFWESATLAQIRDAVSNLAATGLAAALLAFPDGRFTPRWSNAVLIAALLWGVVAWFIPGGLAGDAIWAMLLLASVAALAHRYRRLPDGSQRQQIRWVLFGFAAGAILLTLAMVTGAASETMTGGRVAFEIWFALVSQVLAALGIGCLAGGLLVSLLRYRLYDVDAVISRSAVYGLLTIGFVAVFAGSQKAIETVGERFLEGGFGPVSGGVAAAIGAAVVVPLHNRVHNWAERRFQRGLMHLRSHLPDCVADLRETGDRGEIVDEVLRRTAAGVRANRAAMIIDGRTESAFGLELGEVEEWRERVPLDASSASIECDRADALFPVRLPLRAGHASSGEPIGWLLLGPRPDGSLFGADEREALESLADPVARALRVVQLRDERERRLFAYVDARIAALGSGPGTAA
jgi:hypothetical protein